MGQLIQVLVSSRCKESMRCKTNVDFARPKKLQKSPLLQISAEELYLQIYLIIFKNSKCAKTSILTYFKKLLVCQGKMNFCKVEFYFRRIQAWTEGRIWHSEAQIGRYSRHDKGLLALHTN
jgi:hypothetical protein